MTTPIDLARLEALAKDAAPGQRIFDGRDLLIKSNDRARARPVGIYADDPKESEFIAALDRDTVLALIARIRELRELLDRFRYAKEFMGADSWDWCPECRAQLESAAAHTNRSLGALDPNDLALLGRRFLLSWRRPNEP